MNISHSWLFILTVALAATISYGQKPKLPLADDPLFNKMLPSPDENSLDTDEKIDKKIPLAENPKFNKMLRKEQIEKEMQLMYSKLNKQEDTPRLQMNAMIKGKLGKDLKQNKIDAPIKDATNGTDDDDDYYSYDEYDYSDETTTKGTRNNIPKKVTTTSTTTTTTTTTTSAPSKKPSPKKELKLKPIGGSNLEFEEEVVKKLNSVSDNDSDSLEFDYDYDIDDTNDTETEDAKVVSCPRDCICKRNLNGYMVATCSRLDSGIQKFSTDITDLEVINVSPQYPIVIGSAFFKNIGLGHVTSVKIVDSTIANIHPHAFEGLDQLYAVNLTNSQINLLHPDTFAENKKLRLLTLAGNDLSAMQENASPFIDYMLKAPSVEELDISGCNLKKLLPTAFNRLESVVYINLANNGLKSLPPGIFDQIENIEELDLSWNNISSLPKNIFNRTALAILNLKYNNFESKLDFVTDDIQKLDLSYNNITVVSNTMFAKMTGLTNLILRGNSIKKIHQLAFFPLKNLRQIDLSSNNLEQVSSQLFMGNRDLDVIRLNDNERLKKLPLEGFESETGKFDVYLFDASNCDLNELGDKTFARMPKLTTLNLAWNNIDNLSKDFFSTVSSLIELDLSNNVLSNLNSQIFLNNRNLKKLNLSGNPLKKISPKIFMTTKELLELDISNCDLVELWTESMSEPWLTNVFKNLRMLNASNNKLTHVRHAHLSTMANLKVLDLGENPLHCDEGFKALIKWLTDRKVIPSGVHAGFNAEMKMKDTGAESLNNYSWDTFEHNMCIKASQNYVITQEASTSARNDINDINELVDDDSDVDADSDSDSDSESDEDEDDESADDEDLDEAVNKDAVNRASKSTPSSTTSTTTTASTTNSKTNKIVDLFDGDDSDNSSDDDDDDDDDDDSDDDNNDDEIELDSDKEIIANKDEIAEGLSIIKQFEEQLRNDQYRYLLPILVVIMTVLAVMLLVFRLIAIMMQRRGERYRQALLASKNSIIYQKLSEEIGPTTPKLHRYAPINQV